MTRHILVLLAGLGLSLSLGSCKNFLDTEPSTSQSTESVLRDFDLLRPTLNGLYDDLQGSNSSRIYYASHFLMAADVMGDDIQTSYSGARGSSYYEMNFNAYTNLGCWTIAYQVIRSANRILQMCDNLEGELQGANLTPENRTSREQAINRARGEALAARALAHFDLLRQHASPYPYSNNGAALGVPLVLTPLESNALPGRASVGEVYQQVIADFRKALDLGQLPTTQYGRFSQGSVKALLARVYLYMGTPEGNREALALSKEVIDSHHYSLATTAEAYKEIFTAEPSPEMIFSLVNFDSKDWGDREGLPYVYNVNGYRALHITKKFYDEMQTDPQDLRWSVLQNAEGTYAESAANAITSGGASLHIWVAKYPGKPKLKDMRSNDIPVIRLGEVYLNAAEAAFKLGDNTSALTYLNAIVQRANPAKSVSASELSLKRILDERAKELFAEGHRFFDLMRNGQTCERFPVGQPGWHNTITDEARSFDHTYFRTILPLPQAELNANPTLRAQQNPGY